MNYTRTLLRGGSHKITEYERTIQHVKPSRHPPMYGYNSFHPANPTNNVPHTESLSIIGSTSYVNVRGSNNDPYKVEHLTTRGYSLAGGVSCIISLYSFL